MPFTFTLGFISTVQAQTNPEFKSFLACLNGARWLVHEDSEFKILDRITKQHFNGMGSLENVWNHNETI
jgi:hypothetical protein